MTSRNLDVVALGSCYVDINAEKMPFGSDGIPAETELVGAGYEAVPGGSAVNFCRLLAQLGANPAFIGMAGQDPHGEMLGRLLGQNNVQSALILRPYLQTNVSFNMTNLQGEHIMLVAGTANAALDPVAVWSQLEQLLPQSKLLYLGGCFKLKAFEQSFIKVADIASQSGVKLVIDHGRMPTDIAPSMLEAVKQLVLRADYYFPSRKEFCQLWQVSDIEEGLRHLRDQAPELTVVVKDGSNGAFFWADDSIQHVPGEKVKHPVNVTGAGDSFNAGVMAAITQGHELNEAIDYGCRVTAAKIQNQPLPLL